jgi:3D (Asp-Asp-Asp) domain-containing protein
LSMKSFCDMSNNSLGREAMRAFLKLLSPVQKLQEDGIVHDCGGFIRTRQIDMFGETSYVGVPVEKKAIKY